MPRLFDFDSPRFRARGLNAMPSPHKTPWISRLIAPGFLAVAVWFVAGPQLDRLPLSVPAAVSVDQLSTEPRRTALGDPPFTVVNGFERTCMDCHRLFPPSDDPPRKLMQHAGIVLNHGINDRCRNCHDDRDRDRLVLNDGSPLPFSRAVELCAKCHGPTYRDWQRGMHGRTNGYWDVRSGAPRRLGCTECHDPHNPRSPAMDPIRPLPGPNTLRMTPPTHPRDSSEERDPLRRELAREQSERSP